MALDLFLPVVRDWFGRRLGAPTPAQVRGWPAIAGGGHVLIAAPTGTGKTLAAFLGALDRLLRQSHPLPDETQVLYVSPLRALSNDVQKNLALPLEELRAADPGLPALRVAVRTGDTPASARAAMGRRPPHVLVTTPESLYLLLTSRSGRGQLATVSTVIVDEIHALAKDKRGSHLALSLERLEHLVASRGGRLQRIGLSATQKPLSAVARLLVGVGRECELVDCGRLRELDLDVVVPDIPLAAVCSHEQWGELYEKMAALVRSHRSTLVFVNTRKLAERLAARLTERLGADVVACHHGSLARELRQDAEQRLKEGRLAVLVATASLELGIDIGAVDLVLQVGSARSIATLLQRVGRAGHGVTRRPKGRLLPLTLDEAVEAAALLRALAQADLDRTPEPPAALDVLAQQIVAACVEEPWDLDGLYATLRRAWPYRELSRVDFEACVDLHTRGRHALLHRDGVGGRLLATRRARLPAVTSGGAIPDTADYSVLLEPEGTFLGTLNEDFAIEANVRDIFQLGNASWQILKVEPGIVRVADARGAPPTLPFWVGEAPARTAELSAHVAGLREELFDVAAEGGREAGIEWLAAETRCPLAGLAGQLVDYVVRGATGLGAVPTQRRLVLERFFDESGGQQLVVHSPFGGRINRALGLALRKRFCRSFGFELQAAAGEDAIVISLGAHHSFPLAEVFGYLHSRSARDVLVQALLPTPMFTTRWRWNAVRSLLLPRLRDGKRVPPALQRMRADDLLVRSFPQVMACGETLPPGDLPVPDDPLVRQTVEDCLHEAMDVDGLLALLAGLEEGRIEKHAVDTVEPSAFAHGILAAQPYAFLDDAPLEERRTQAVLMRRSLPAEAADTLGALDPAAVAQVRAQAWPDPRDAEELHEALGWMGFVAEAEAHQSGWERWLAELGQQGRVVAAQGRWFATEAPRQGASVLAGRLEALGPVAAADPLFTEFAVEVAELQAAGSVLFTRVDGRPAWCNRRLLARIHQLTLAGLRQQIEPVGAADFARFVAAWQHATPERRLAGARGLFEVLRQLAGWQAPAPLWEQRLLPARVAGFRREWLDELSLTGELAWGRLWGAGAAPIGSVPVGLLPREDVTSWLGLCTPGDCWSLKGGARVVYEQLVAQGPSFAPELLRSTGLLPGQLDAALGALVGLGLASCDSFAGLRALVGTRDTRRRRGGPPAPAGRWSLFRRPETPPAPPAEFIARQLLLRTGVVFRRVALRERIPFAWRELLAVYRRLEARGEIRGGRFVSGFSGEQYALPDAVLLLRQVRDEPAGETGQAKPSPYDPLSLDELLVPDAPSTAGASRHRVA